MGHPTAHNACNRRRVPREFMRAVSGNESRLTRRIRAPTAREIFAFPFMIRHAVADDTPAAFTTVPGYTPYMSCMVTRCSRTRATSAW